MKAVLYLSKQLHVSLRLQIGPDVRNPLAFVNRKNQRGSMRQTSSPDPLGPVRIRHGSHQSTIIHTKLPSSPIILWIRAGWQVKMAPIEFRIPWHNAHRPSSVLFRGSKKGNKGDVTRPAELDSSKKKRKKNRPYWSSMQTSQPPLPRSEQTGMWLVQFCAWNSATITNVNASTMTSTTKKKNSKSVSSLYCLFTLSLCRRGRDCEVKKILLLFCPFPKKLVSTPLSHRLCLKTNYERMVWSLRDRP